MSNFDFESGDFDYDDDDDLDEEFMEELHEAIVPTEGVLQTVLGSRHYRAPGCVWLGFWTLASLRGSPGRKTGNPLWEQSARMKAVISLQQDQYAADNSWDHDVDDDDY